ncbi:MAG: selenocysteine-specific translation elongation factor [Actinobacteria bacterium 13_1_20CM_3_71_11]|nr:MAG: selenocysteine-specific translation elongation factor [Actinobacteria bacterium 13_1_20CM_3_71_11]
MHVVATAGHVDHGKSTLVRALTGMEPDRWAQERSRGMTIDLGFAWTTLPSGAVVAFVDVPGHERFVPNMLAGVGPVPAALVVVAADEGWMPQSEEHLAALDALGVRHGLLAITRTDLAAPSAAAGLDELRAALDRLVARLPVPDPEAPVRLWVDRSFTIRGAGTVVTGTLGAGTVRAGDELELAGTGRRLRVRSVQALGAPTEQVTAVARVGLNLRGVDRDQVRRGDALLTPHRFQVTDLIDVRLSEQARPGTLTLHIGSAAVGVRVRPLGTDTARLRLDRPLPLRIGDRALLRDPGRHRIAAGVTVLDVVPPALRRRGAAAARAAALSSLDGRPDERVELHRRGLARQGDLERMGVTVHGAPVAGDWHADPGYWQGLRARLAEEVTRHAAAHALAPEPPVEVLRQALDLPDRALVDALRGRHGGPTAVPGLPEPVAAAVARVRAQLDDRPFAAPDAQTLARLGLGHRELAAAVRAGALLRVAAGIVLLPDAAGEAVRVLAALPQPFTLSQARQALGTSRRVAVPLLELLDRQGATRRLPDDRRTVVPGSSDRDG